MEERTILADVSLAVAYKVVDCLKGMYASELIKVIFPTGAKNVDIVTWDDSISPAQLRKMATFAQGACWGIVAVRGY